MVAFKLRLEHLYLLVREPGPALLVLILIALALAALLGGRSRGSGPLFLTADGGRLVVRVVALLLVVLILFLLVCVVVDALIFIYLFAL